MGRIELYECQKRFIIDAKRVIGLGEVGIFSSPTGTGKTASLLISAIGEACSIGDASTISEGRMLELLFSRRHSRTRVFYSSKTHVQLSQALNELKRLNILCNSVILGSRMTYCVNEKVNECKDLDGMNNRCEQMVKDGACSFYDGFCGVSSGIVDVEEFVKSGRKQGFCPYYASREYAQECDVVFLPYQLLFTDSGRKSANIDVQDAIVIVDEAHNIYESIIQMNTASVSFCIIDKCIRALRVCRSMCLSKAGNTKLLHSTIEILERISGFGTSPHVMKISGDECAMRVSEFAIRLCIDDFNMLEVEEYLTKTGLIHKLEDLDAELGPHIAEIARFLYLLVMSDKGGRIFYSKMGVKFVPLDLSIYFGVS